MRIFVTILVLIVMLGILISTHEAGHLWAAKRFGVYCFEYSVGFGPALISSKKWTKPLIRLGKKEEVKPDENGFVHAEKEELVASDTPSKGETAYSLRLIPLGGYVSMYGEEMDETPNGVKVPFSRSLNGISVWKKVIILLAGVTVNLITSLAFVFVYSVAFPTLKSYERFSVPSEQGNISLYAFHAEGRINTLEFNESDTIYSPVPAAIENNGTGFIIDPASKINEEEYVAVFVPISQMGESFLPNLQFYKAAGGFVVTEEREQYGLIAAPDANMRYTPKDNDNISLTLTIIDSSLEESKWFENRRSETVSLTGATLKEESLWIKSYSFYKPFGEAMGDFASNYSYFFEMIGLGLKSLFTFDFSNLGGIVAIGSGISQLSTMMGFERTFFYYGGFIALDLAIFNLLPFPGLDGWQLFVTAFETIRKKPVSQKVKGIMSTIGFVLLIALAAFLVVKDILRLVL